MAARVPTCTFDRNGVLFIRGENMQERREERILSENAFFFIFLGLISSGLVSASARTGEKFCHFPAVKKLLVTETIFKREGASASIFLLSFISSHLSNKYMLKQVCVTVIFPYFLTGPVAALVCWMSQSPFIETRRSFIYFLI